MPKIIFHRHITSITAAATISRSSVDASIGTVCSIHLYVGFRGVIKSP
ncbi:hypothetical protein J7L02_01210 [Candidatus Woesearchaeota archaeon]|nr:hypothetical protein [Candidatus Woesearchaeota archaeon]